MLKWEVKESHLRKSYKKLILNNLLKQSKIYDTGWGNGYVFLPKDHIWYGKHYDELYDEFSKDYFHIHGGLTYSNYNDDKSYWVIGFDTAHLDDDLTNCSKEYVEKETIKLYKYCLSKYWLTYRKHKLKNILKNN